MKKLLTIIFLFLVTCLPVLAQNTTVSGQITDAGGQSWNDGTFQFVFVPNPSYPSGPYTWTGGMLPTDIRGTINGTGGYSVSIPTTSTISPQGSSWKATFCPLATSPCASSQNTTVQGTTQTLNLTPAAIAIDLVNPPSSTMRAYSDAEIVAAVIASEYYNLPSQLFRVCQAVSGQTCTTWANIGTGGGGGGGPTIQTNAVNNINQATLNFTSSTANVTGLSINPSNPSSGNEIFEASGTVNATSGGSGRVSPTAHFMLAGEGSSPFGMISPGSTVGWVLTSNGLSADPTFQAPLSAAPSYPQTVSGSTTSGGVLFLSSATQVSSSGLLGNGQFVLGGGAGGAPTTSFSVVPSANGGVGIGSPTAHTVPIAEGSSPYAFQSPGALGGCFMSNGTSADPTFQSCPSASAPGAANSLIYSAGGGVFAALAPQTTNGVYFAIENVTGGVSVAPTLALGGVLTNPQTGTSYTYGAAFTNADRFGYTSFSNAASQAITLPQANTTGFTSNWGNVSCAIGAGTASINPQTSKINFVNGSAYSANQTSMQLGTGQCAFIYSNNTDYFAIKIGGSGLIASGTSTATTGTPTLTPGSCAAPVTASAPGVTTSNVIGWGLQGDISGITGFGPGSGGGLYIEAYPSANNVNFKTCLPISAPGNVTPGSDVPLNWSVR